MKINNKKLYLSCLICLVIFTIGIVHKTLENDTFFTIATGDYILNNGINEDEPFTYHENLKFVKLRWAFDVVVSKIYNISGFQGIYLFTLIVAVGIAITLFTLLVKNNSSKLVSLILVTFTMFFCSNYLKCRAQIISYLLFILEFYCIERLVKNNNKKYSVYLVIISYLILCFHSSVWLVYFLFYIPYIVEYLLVKLKINKKIKINKMIIEEHNIKLLIITLLIAICTGFLTPLGLSPFTYMFKVMNGISKEIIVELRPLTLIKAYPLILFLAFSVFASLFPKTKIKITDLFFILGFSLMSVMAERNLYISLFIITYPVVRIINSCINEYDKNKIVEKIENNINKKIIYKLIILCVYIALFAKLYPEVSDEKYIDETKYPVKAVEYIKNNLDVDNIRIFNSFNYGSYIEFKKIPAFIDSRSEIYTKEFNNVTILEDWAACEYYYTKPLDELIEKYNITHVLKRLYVHHSMYLGKYKLVKLYQDDEFGVYEVVEQ